MFQHVAAGRGVSAALLDLRAPALGLVAQAGARELAQPRAFAGVAETPSPLATSKTALPAEHLEATFDLGAQLARRWIAGREERERFLAAGDRFLAHPGVSASPIRAASESGAKA